MKNEEPWLLGRSRPGHRPGKPNRWRLGFLEPAGEGEKPQRSPPPKLFPHKLEMPLLSVNVESIEELEILISLAEGKNVRSDISLRINLDVDSPTHPYVATGLALTWIGSRTLSSD